MKVYKSNISKFSIILFIIMIIIVITPLLISLIFENENNLYGILLFTIIYFVFIFSIAFKTNYKFKNNLLYWQSGPFYGKIDIKTIIKIKHHNGIFVPTIWKPALSHIGLIITYNKYDDIYISPKNEAEFIEQILEINPTIEII